MSEPQDIDPFEQAKAQFLAGLDCQQGGDFTRAEQHYKRSLALLPGRASTLTNLAATQLCLARPRDALATAGLALAAEANNTDALLHHATALARLGRPHEALAAFSRLLERVPDHALAWSSSGGLLREMQRLDEAALAFRNALAHGAEDDLNTYYLAAVAAGDAPATAPRTYVQGLFDDYAEGFDAHVLGQLNYQAHLRLLEGLAALALAPFGSALDLGCGTGLCGSLIRPMARHLSGLDLSAGMLDKARDTGVYDQLEQTDLVQFLHCTDQVYDLLVAADVFIHVGDLDPVFEGAGRVMNQGIFCFSLETLGDIEGQSRDYRLLPSLRYAHSKPYIQTLASRHGFEVLGMHSGPVRQEQRQTIAGLFVYLRRQVNGATPNPI